MDGPWLRFTVTPWEWTGLMLKHLEAIQEAALAQHGLVTLEDLTVLGVGRVARRRLIDDGVLVRVGRRTLRLAGALPTAHQKVMRACLDTGGVASHRTAAWLHGLDGFEPGGAPEVTVTRRSFDYSVSAAHVHTTTWLSEHDVVAVAGVPVFSVARTLFSLASLCRVDPASSGIRFGGIAARGDLGVRGLVTPRELPTSLLSFDMVRGAVDGAVANRKATDPWLWWFLERIRQRGRPGVSVFEAVLSVRAGGLVTESWLEREALRVLAEHGVPLPICQARIEQNGAFAARVDFAYAPARLIVEVSGHAWHATKAQRAADSARRRKLTLAGFRVLEYTYDDVVSRPAAMATEILDALVASQAS